MGLLAMEERAVELGGQLAVESAPGSGTRIILVWAIDEGGKPNE
jgi:signal transduction histidine kinase